MLSGSSTAFRSPCGAELRQDRARLKPRRNGRGNDVAAAVNVADEIVDVFRTGHDVGRDSAGKVIDHGRQDALSEVIHRQFQIGRGEGHVHTLLGGDRHRDLLFRGVLKRGSRARAHGVIVRQTDTQRRTDLRAATAELIVILLVDHAQEGVAVAEKLNGFAGDPAKRQKTIRH
jgi:hypothetical protein